MSTWIDLPKLPPADAPDLFARVELLLTLVRALHKVGQPTHRLESNVVAVGRHLGLTVQIMALPTGAIFSIQTAGGPQTQMLRLSGARLDLWRWTQLASISEDIKHGGIDPTTARQRIDAVMRSREPWGRLATIGAYILSAGAFSIFFGAGVAELIVSLFVGLAVGTVAVTMHSARASRLFELVASLAAGLVVGMLDMPLGVFTEWIPLAAGLIILLPGIALVDSIEELAQGHVVAGGARLAGVAVVFLAMTFGVLVGYKITEPLPGPGVNLVSIPLSQWVLVLAIPVVALGSLVRFRARLGDFWLILLSSAVALGATRLSSAQLGSIVGEFAGAFSLGLVANLCGRLRKCVPEMLVYPGLALLVPGSFGLRTVESLMSKNADVAVYTAFEMFMIAMALVAGLLFSNIVIRDRTLD